MMVLYFSFNAFNFLFCYPHILIKSLMDYLLQSLFVVIQYVNMLFFWSTLDILCHSIPLTVPSLMWHENEVVETESSGSFAKKITLLCISFNFFKYLRDCQPISVIQSLCKWLPSIWLVTPICRCWPFSGDFTLPRNYKIIFIFVNLLAQTMIVPTTFVNEMYLVYSLC